MVPRHRCRPSRSAGAWRDAIDVLSIVGIEVVPIADHAATVGARLAVTERDPSRGHGAASSSGIRIHVPSAINRRAHTRSSGARLASVSAWISKPGMIRALGLRDEAFKTDLPPPPQRRGALERTLVCRLSAPGSRFSPAGLRSRSR